MSTQDNTVADVVEKVVSATTATYSSANIIQSTYAHWIIFGISIASIAWGVVQTLSVSILSVSNTTEFGVSEPDKSKT